MSFGQLLELAPDAMLVVDARGRIVQANTKAASMFGYSLDELRGASIELLVPDRLRPVHATHRDCYATHPRPRAMGRPDLDLVAVRKDGTDFAVDVALSPFQSDGADLVLASVRDVSALRALADEDPLTGLHNRRRFERELAQHVRRARRYGEDAVLLMIDVDGFKQINDRFGHRVGDRALRAIAAVLADRVRETDIAARVGGDEFAVLLPHTDAPHAEVVAESLRQAVGKCAVAGAGRERIYLSVSIGTAIIDSRDASELALMTEADQAMYRDKRRRESPAVSAQQ
jgi:diguanylate cyclase (GGDEF)-like protein/PAS domain S-box-containing protein